MNDQIVMFAEIEVDETEEIRAEENDYVELGKASKETHGFGSFGGFDFGPGYYF